MNRKQCPFCKRPVYADEQNQDHGSVLMDYRGSELVIHDCHRYQEEIRRIEDEQKRKEDQPWKTEKKIHL